MKRRGPRADTNETREVILQAAREQFALHGYDATTLRGIARAAGVDGALPSYHFGSKSSLFIATLQLPVHPGAIIEALAAGGPDGIGERLVRTALTVWDDPEAGAPLIRALRAVVSRGEVMREFLAREIVPRLAATIDGPDAELRAAATATQMFGLLSLRYALELEPLASAPREELVALYGPTFQRYLAG